MQNIPSVNLSDFLSEDDAVKQKFVSEIGNAYQTIGFVAVKGHFLNSNLQTNLYQEIKAFFDLPLETKKKYEIAGIGGQRGYVSFGKEHAKGQSAGDLKEFWHFGQYVKENSKYAALYPANVVVKELENFNAVGKETYQMLEKTGVYLLRALALFIGLEEFYFDKFVTDGNSILRPIHYPPITQEPKDGAVRAAAHGDINLITLLMGAQGKGLQVQNHDGTWMDAIAAEDEIIVNVGDMLARLTNNQLKSTIHRVVNPEREDWGKSRYSVPFFMHPVADMPLHCLPECVTELQPKQFEDCTAGEYLHERLVELGLIK